MDQATCNIENCQRPRYQRRLMCASHSMKAYRHGDPHYRAPRKYHDITGQRFGLLTIERREGRDWVCRCDCGRTTAIPAGSLNRGQTTCGDRTTHWRQDLIGYFSLHHRLDTDRGRAATHQCVDCGHQAQHWSYNNEASEELVDDQTGLAYSLDLLDYSPRCVRCHSAFDRDHRANAS